MSTPSSGLTNLLRQAEQLLVIGKTAEATEIVKHAYAQDKTNPDVLVLVAQVSSQPDVQRNALQRALQASPNHVRARALLARLEAGQPLLVLPALPSVPVVATASRQPELRENVSPSAPARANPPQSLAYEPVRSVTPITASSKRPLLLAGGAGVVAVFALLVFLLTRGSGTPDGVARTFIHAVLNNDDTSAMNVLTSDLRSQTGMFCSPPYAACLLQTIKLPAGAQDIGSALVSQTGQSAVARVQLRFPNSPTEMCQTVQLQNEGGWRVARTQGIAIPCVSNPVAAMPTQPPLGMMTVAPVDTTVHAPMQTATQLALTRGAMLAAPTLTAAVLAPGFTQTALVNDQNNLNTAIAATQTQSAVQVTLTAQFAGMTSTSVAFTQTSVSVTQRAVTFKSTLSGTLAAATKRNGELKIVTLSANGTNLKVLNVTGNNPLWSPDGQQIAYTKRDRTAFVYTMTADGLKDTYLPFEAARFGSDWATWSPDGKRVMVEVGTRFGLHAVFIINADGTNATQLIDDVQAGGWTSWSPDGTQVLYTKDDQVWVVGIDGGTPRSLAKQAGVRQAAWSPDGTQIAFNVDTDRAYAIYTLRADGSNLKRITDDQTFVGLPTWSPDNMHIATVCFGGQRLGNNLCVLNADGSALVNLTTDGGYEGRVAWKK